MQQALQVTFHNLPHSDALEADVRDRSGRLAELYDRIIGCRVVIDSPHRNQVRGKTYSVRIEMHVPGQEIVVSREPIGDLRIAVEEAFNAAKRRLKDFKAKQRGD